MSKSTAPPAKVNPIILWASVQTLPWISLNHCLVGHKFMTTITRGPEDHLSQCGEAYEAETGLRTKASSDAPRLEISSRAVNLPLRLLRIPGKMHVKDHCGLQNRL